VAQVWLRSGVDPDAPDEVVLMVVVDPAGTPGERAVARLADYGYEGDGALYLVRTDGWVERRLDGRTLVIDVVAYPALLEGADLAGAGFPERSQVDPQAVRLLRLTTVVDPVEYAHAPEATAVLSAPAGSTPDGILAAVRAGDAWPVIYGPPPDPGTAAPPDPENGP
jgi:hypothetical protein